MNLSPLLQNQSGNPSTGESLSYLVRLPRCCPSRCASGALPGIDDDLLSAVEVALNITSLATLLDGLLPYSLLWSINSECPSECLMSLAPYSSTLQSEWKSARAVIPRLGEKSSHGDSPFPTPSFSAYKLPQDGKGLSVRG